MISMIAVTRAIVVKERRKAVTTIGRREIKGLRSRRKLLPWLECGHGESLATSFGLPAIPPPPVDALLLAEARKSATMGRLGWVLNSVYCGISNPNRNSLAVKGRKPSQASSSMVTASLLQHHHTSQYSYIKLEWLFFSFCTEI
jgi:hypothetical protein